jgi:hypothetical protein
LNIRDNSISERIANVVDPKGDADVAPFRYNSGNIPIITDFQDSIFAFDPQTPTNDPRILGIEFAEDHFWITGAGTGGVDSLHKFDASGNHVATYPQGVTSAWGWRDMAWDGNYLYASDSDTLVQLQIIGGVPTPTGIGIPGPTNPNRGLAYDPATDHFWTANFGSNIWEFDRTGAIINAYSNSKAIYGLAWDDLSDGGPFLWVHSQDGPGVDTLMEISQFDPVSGTYTGVSWQGGVYAGNTTAIAGGACFTTEWDNTIGALFVIGQGEPVDFVFGYEITDNITWLTLQSGGSGDVAPDDSALIEFLVDFRDTTIVEDSTYQADANINNNSTAPTPIIHFAITAAAGGCEYVVGDVNGSDNYNGLDITYGVNFFKYGSPDPQCDPDCPPCAGWHYCGDVNASCNYNGLDITYGVNYFKYGSPGPVPCADCPPIEGPVSIRGNELKPSSQGNEFKPVVQPTIEMKSKSTKGKSLKR